MGSFIEGSGMKYQPYRDEPFQRDCEDRYKTIKFLASRFTRPFSVLDVGANYGWFGQQLVKDFEDCAYIGVDNKTIDPHPRIWHVNRHMAAAEFGALSKSENFDIVLCLSVLHHFEDYERAFNAMKRLGQYTFFEIPGPNEDEAVGGAERHAAIAKIFEGGEAIAEHKSHLDDTLRPMYLLQSEPFITEQTLDVADRGSPGYTTYKIHSDFNRCLIEIDRTPVEAKKEIRNFIPGMNAHNFRLLGGKVDIPEIENHPDPKPWNYIIGDGVHAIDTLHVKAR